MEFRVPETIETDRLVLRQFRDEDWRDLHDYYSDETATAYTFGWALTEGQSWRAMASMIGHWHLRGYGPYAVEKKSSGKVLGPVGFWYPNDWPEPEIKWALARPHWGHGFASEATRAVQKAGREHMPDIHLISLINSANAQSIQLAQAGAARFEKAIQFRGETFHVYRHPE